MYSKKGKKWGKIDKGLVKEMKKVGNESKKDAKGMQRGPKIK